MENPPPIYRVYRLHWGQRAFALLFLAFSVFFVIGSWRSVLFEQEEPRPLLLILSVIFLAVGAGLTVNAYQTTVTFTSDTIEMGSIMSRRRLPLNGIRGRRELVASGEEGGSTRYLCLVPDDDRLPTLQLMKGYSIGGSTSCVTSMPRTKRFTGTRTLALSDQCPVISPQSMTSIMPITMMLVPQAIMFHRRRAL